MKFDSLNLPKLCNGNWRMWKRSLYLDRINPQNPIDFTVYTPFYMNLAWRRRWESWDTVDGCSVKKKQKNEVWTNWSNEDARWEKKRIFKRPKVDLELWKQILKNNNNIKNRIPGIRFPKFAIRIRPEYTVLKSGTRSEISGFSKSGNLPGLKNRIPGNSDRVFQTGYFWTPLAKMKQ